MAAHVWATTLTTGKCSKHEVTDMVSIHHTPQGWTLVRSENLGYYTSLGDVMDAAYAATKGQKCYSKPDLSKPKNNQ